MFGLSSASHAVVAEWLRRLTRNQFRSAGVGSNPTDREYFFIVRQCGRGYNESCCMSQQEHRWFSGRMLAVPSGRPGLCLPPVSD